MRTLLVVLLGLLVSSAASAASITVFLERDGQRDGRIEIPRFGGGDRTWRIMSSSDRRRARSFVDVDVPCGEKHARIYDNGDASQSSYRRLVELVGLRDASPLRSHARGRRHRRD